VWDRQHRKTWPEWIPGRIFLSYFVGVILILAGVCLLPSLWEGLGEGLESAHGGHHFRAYDSADGVMDLLADAPGRAHRVLVRGADDGIKPGVERSETPGSST
jgi:hypothetical protein